MTKFSIINSQISIPQHSSSKHDFNNSLESTTSSNPASPLLNRNKLQSNQQIRIQSASSRSPSRSITCEVYGIFKIVFVIYKSLLKPIQNDSEDLRIKNRSMFQVNSILQSFNWKDVTECIQQVESQYKYAHRCIR